MDRPDDESAAKGEAVNRRPRGRRWLRHLALGLGALLLILGAVAWWLLATDSGARWLFGRVSTMVPGALEVAQLNGPIRGPLEVEDLVWRDEGIEVRVARLSLEWRLRALLSKQLDIVSLDAERVRITSEPGEESAEPTILPDVNLPINIIVRQAQVRDIRVITTSPSSGPSSGPSAPPESADDPEALVIDSIDLMTETRGEFVEIERLAVRSAELNADLRGRVRPQGAYPVDLELGWSYSPAGEPTAWSGEATLSGDLDDLRIDHDLQAPIAVRLDARLTTPLRDLSFDATADIEPFDLSELAFLFEADSESDTDSEDFPAMSLGGTLSVQGTVERFAASGSLTAETADYGPLAARFELVKLDERIDVDELLLTTPAAPSEVRLTGRLNLPEATSGAEAESPLGFDLAASWTDLVWPLVPAERDAAETVVTSSRGNATIAGTAETYDLEVEATIAGGGLPETPINLAGRGGTERLEISRLGAALLDGEVVARGSVAWSPQVEWQLDLQGQNLDPSAFEGAPPELTGRLVLDAATSGLLTEAGVVGRVAPFSLSGTLRDRPLRASGAVDLDGERILVEDLIVDWQNAHAELAGQVTPQLDLTARLNVPELAELLPEAAGSLDLDLGAEGPTEAPRIRFTLNGEKLAWTTTTIEALDVRGDLDLAPAGDLDLDLTAERLSFGEPGSERIAKTATLDLEGSREEHRLSLVADFEPSLDVGADTETDVEALALELVAEGALSTDYAWSGRLTTLDLQVPEAGRWSLVAPAALTASAEGATLDRLCERSGEARLCVEGVWSAATGWNADAQIEAVPLALVQSFLPPDTAISGTVDGTVSARGSASGSSSEPTDPPTDSPTNGAIQVTADFALGPGKLVYSETGVDGETVRFARGSLTGRADESGVHAVLQLPLPDLGSAEGEITLPGYVLGAQTTDDQPITGRLDAEITDLGFLQAFSDQLDETAGRLDADLRLSGTLARPDIRGRASLSEGRATVPALGISISDLVFDARSNDADGFRLTGSAKSGGGDLRFEGASPLVPSADSPARVAITGQRFAAMSTPEITLMASPDLELTYDGAGLSLTGEVLIPEAEIEIEKAPPGVVTVSDDVVFVGRDLDPVAAESGMPLSMRVRVVLGEEVEIAVLGLEAKPSGSLLLVENPGSPTTGTGEIDVSGGTFKAYGQDLTIERGRLVFAGPIDDPQIDIRAYREARDGVVAGLEATGTLGAPVITLWSEPPMAQADQLAYLLLGRPLDQADQGDGDLMAKAAASLGLKGGNLLAERLATRFGLEEARIETDGGIEEASLVLGKYLTPRLYVAYGVGLFEAVNTLRIRYLLSSKWTLQATTGEAAGADILYTIERGRGAKRRIDPIEPEELAPRPVDSDESDEDG